MRSPKIAILGAGPAGLGAAQKLAERSFTSITVLEQNEWVGGNAGSFDVDGIPVDFGSHRLHPACDPDVFQDIQRLLGAALLRRPRHGRIKLQGRWIHFPLKPFDLALRLPPGFSLGVLSDAAAKLISRNGKNTAAETFASVMQKGLGRTICEEFYFPYARKIWGLDPELISPTQAQRRVSNSSLYKMVKKAVSVLPGLKSKESGIYYYPRNGFGEISQAYCRSAVSMGVNISLGSRVKAVHMNEDRGAAVVYEKAGELVTQKVDYVWSTIPITVLARLMDPGPPSKLLEDTQRIEYRSMILIYLVLSQGRFSEYDAHYFPESRISITRLSEPKNYGDRRDPEDTTVLCAELPCSTEAAEWSMSDDELKSLVLGDLETAGIPVKAPVQGVEVRRLRYAYPIYRAGYEEPFKELDEWIDNVEHLLTFGRQGLFAHDNTHHALYMAYSAVSCLDDQGQFDRDCWKEYRRVFDTHVVED